MNTKKAMYRRAWRQIRQLEQAKNMVEVDKLVKEASWHTFKLLGHGVYRINQRKAGVPEERIESQLEFWRTMAMMHRQEFFEAIMPYIPARLKTSRMYSQLADAFGIRIFQLPKIES